MSTLPHPDIPPCQSIYTGYIYLLVRVSILDTYTSLSEYLYWTHIPPCQSIYTGYIYLLVRVSILDTYTSLSEYLCWIHIPPKSLSEYLLLDTYTSLSEYLYWIHTCMPPCQSIYTGYIYLLVRAGVYLGGGRGRGRGGGGGYSPPLSYSRPPLNFQIFKNSNTFMM